MLGENREFFTRTLSVFNVQANSKQIIMNTQITEADISTIDEVKEVVL